MTLEQRRRPFNGGDLPLFAWAERQRWVYVLPLPARRIRDRFGLSPAAAIVTAELAGFAMELARALADAEQQARADGLLNDG